MPFPIYFKAGSGSIRMAPLFDYILQAHSGGERAISSPKSPSHQTRDSGRPLARLIINVSISGGMKESSNGMGKNFNSAARSIFEPNRARKC